jgi:hypothetical protein
MPTFCRALGMRAIAPMARDNRKASPLQKITKTVRPIHAVIATVAYIEGEGDLLNH